MTQPKRPDAVEVLIAEFVASGARELHVRCHEFELYRSNDADSPGIDDGRAAASVEIGAGSLRPGDASRPATRRPEPGAAVVVAGPDLADMPEGTVIVRAPSTLP